ncbi:uncharacterized protein LOC125839017 [Solanum verrucosum]|uniref:uncharacterized protein LOC125839017 n=1 Tax=Solanum verrucosum TaxID=315347 RepID=UPI0020D0DD7C|nr:uncharacterized protein LOC125839017 [Solanum verrucosum]
MSEEEVNGSQAGHQDGITDINNVYNPSQPGEMGAICLPQTEWNAIFELSLFSAQLKLKITTEDDDRGLVVVTRSGKVAIGDMTGNKEAQMYEENKGMEEEETPIHQSIAKEPQKDVEKYNPIPKVMQPLPKISHPFPQRLKKKNEDEKFKKFLSMFKTLSINLPLVEALLEMSGYAKFMKELVTKKMSLDFETIEVSHSCSAIMTKELIKRREDPGAFTIPCTIAMFQFAKALCDLGASINLMSYAIYKQLGLDAEIPIILERLFLETGRVLVDVESGELKFWVNEDEVTFIVCMSMKHPSDIHVVSTVDVIDEAVASAMNVVAALSGLGVGYSKTPLKLDIDLKNRESPPAKPSTEEPPNLELKVLPSHLRYAFLEENNTLPVINAADLLEWQLDSDCKPSVEHQRRLNPPMLYNAPARFQRYILSIFADMVEDSIEEKCHFMLKKGIVLGHKVSQKGLEVDKAKFEVIEKLPPRISIKGVRSFLGHADFYRRFIKDFSKIAHPLCKLLEKEVKFHFDDACMVAFKCLKEKLVSTPVIISPDWSESFEVMCDASGTALGVVLGQKCNKLFHPIYYASKTLDSAQHNYTVTEQALLVVVYAFEKFREYLLGTKVVVHTDHVALRYLMAKKDVKPRLIRENDELEIDINDSFPDKHVFTVILKQPPWYADFANYVVCGIMLDELNFYQQKRFLFDVKKYFWDEPYLYRECADHIIKRCVPEEEAIKILHACHASPVGGHHSGVRMTAKVLQSGYYWPSVYKDAYEFVKKCTQC